MTKYPRDPELDAICRPYQVNLYGVPPLVGTLSSTEREFAMALIIRGCQMQGEWAPVNVRALAEKMEQDSMLRRWADNPFLRPDFESLVADGLLHAVAPVDADPSAVFIPTVAGLERIRKHVGPKMWKLIHTDNLAGDYPDEREVTELPGVGKEGLQKIANIINDLLGERASRFYRVVEIDHVLAPGFEP